MGRGLLCLRSLSWRHTLIRPVAQQTGLACARPTCTRCTPPTTTHAVRRSRSPRVVDFVNSANDMRSAFEDCLGEITVSKGQVEDESKDEVGGGPTRGPSHVPA